MPARVLAPSLPFSSRDICFVSAEPAEALEEAAGSDPARRRPSSSSSSSTTKLDGCRLAEDTAAPPTGDGTQVQIHRLNVEIFAGNCCFVCRIAKKIHCEEAS